MGFGDGVDDGDGMGLVPPGWGFCDSWLLGAWGLGKLEGNALMHAVNEQTNATTATIPHVLRTNILYETAISVTMIRQLSLSSIAPDSGECTIPNRLDNRPNLNQLDPSYRPTQI